MDKLAIIKPLTLHTEQPGSRYQSASVTSRGSVQQLALQEMALEQDDALSETLENMSLAVGGRLKSAQRDGNENDRIRQRVLMLKLVAELSDADPAVLDRIVSTGEHLSALMDGTDTGDADPGEVALQATAWLAKGNHDHPSRQKVEERLAALLADRSIAFSAFCALEHGIATPELRRELVDLYHNAASSRPKLSQWLEMLGDSEGRKDRIKVLLRTLAWELSISGQPIEGAHLATVIDDLKRLVCILSLEDHCTRAADMLSLPGMRGENLLQAVVRLTEQFWASSDTIQNLFSDVDERLLYRTGNTVYRLVQMLPMTCFVDDEQRTQLLDSVMEFCDRYADVE